MPFKSDDIKAWRSVQVRKKKPLGLDGVQCPIDDTQ